MSRRRIIAGNWKMNKTPSEAVELAKRYSTEDSASFINAILAKVVKENELD